MSVPAHDFLDSYVVAQKIRPKPWDTLFDLDATLDRALDGHALSLLGLSELNLINLSYTLLPDYWDVAVHLAVAPILIYVFSFPVLLRIVGASGLEDRYIVAAGTLHYSLMPHNPHVIGSFAALSILGYGIHRATIGEWSRWLWLCFLMPPLLDQSVFGAIFYYPVLFFGVLLLTRASPIRSRLLTALVLSGMLAVIVDYRLFLQPLVSSIETHRHLWLEGRSFDPLPRLFDSATWSSVLDRMIALYRATNPDAPHYRWNIESSKTLIVALSIVLALAAHFYEGRSEQQKRALRSGLRRIAMSSGILAILALAYGLVWQNVFDIQALLGVPIQLQRFIIFVPGLAVVLVSVGLSIWRACVPRSRWILVPVLCLFVAQSVAHAQGVGFRWENLVASKVPPVRTPIATYYQEELFESIKQELGPRWEDEVVMSIGSDPFVAAFHGFRHLDGYLQAYSALYKGRFRRVMSEELERNPKNRKYFDGWGSRIYYFPAEQPSNEAIRLHLDVCAFQELGGTLILSDFEILNAPDIGVRLVLKITESTQARSQSKRLYRPVESYCETGNLDR